VEGLEAASAGLALAGLALAGLALAGAFVLRALAGLVNRMG
jgi:hypothetical protein